MKKIILLASLLLQILCVSAQKINCADSLKVFYTKYLTYDVGTEYNERQKSLVSSCSTKDLYDAWYEDVHEVGLYDPLTLGGGATPDDLDFVKESLSVMTEKDYYVVSFAFHGWQGDINKIVVNVYVNAEGKISHTKRPSDGYMTPDL